MTDPVYQPKTATSKKHFFTPSLRWTLVLKNFVLLFLLVVGLSLISIRETRFFHEEIMHEISSSLDDKQQTYANAILHCLSENAGQAIAGYQFIFINQLLEHITADDEEIVYLMVTDRNGRIFAHSDVTRVGSVLSDPLDLEMTKTLDSQFPAISKENYAVGAHYARFVDLRDEENIVVQREAFHPIYIDDQKWGLLRCRFNLAGVSSELQSSKRRWEDKIKSIQNESLLITIIVFTLATLVAIGVVKYLNKATDELNRAVKNISEGNLDFVLPKQKISFLEFSFLIDSFNEMTRKLRESYNKLDQYGKNLAVLVRERTLELEKAQDALVKKAHEAGMAEMAVGILHNIGNAITPAKISNLLLLRHMKKSSLSVELEAAMGEIIAALKEPEKISHEEKERLIAISKLLPETVKEEHEVFLEQFQAIYEKLEHIETIISLQMRYARLVNGTEEVHLNELVEDALKMLKESLANRKIEISKDLHNLPPANIEKGKMMQIVINLVKNAYEAIDANAEQNRKIAISTRFEQGPPDFAVLMIKDSGIGFAEEEKENLFKFGYTTKSRGSGFGLHSCANFLIANHGEIKAYSEGRKKGATFTVKVPVRGGAKAQMAGGPSPDKEPAPPGIG